MAIPVANPQPAIYCRISMGEQVAATGEKGMHTRVLDYFRLGTSGCGTPKHPFRENKAWMEQLHSVTGEDKPRRVPIYVAHNDPDQTFSTRLLWYTRGGGTICTSEGPWRDVSVETAGGVEVHRQQGWATRKVKMGGDSGQVRRKSYLCTPETCPELRETKVCMPEGRLLCNLRWAQTVGPAAVFATHGWYSIQAIQYALRRIVGITRGLLMGIPLELQMWDNPHNTPVGLQPLKVVTVAFEGEAIATDHLFLPPEELSGAELAVYQKTYLEMASQSEVHERLRMVALNVLEREARQEKRMMAALDLIAQSQHLPHSMAALPAGEAALEVEEWQMPEVPVPEEDVDKELRAFASALGWTESMLEAKRKQYEDDFALAEAMKQEVRLLGPPTPRPTEDQPTDEEA